MKETSPVSLIPDTAALLAGLQATIGEEVLIVDRRPNYWASTFPSEVVCCKLPGQASSNVLCKYGVTGVVRSAFGHRRGTQYEGQIYDKILRPLALSSPRFFGAYPPPDSVETWLMIEFLGDGAGVDETPSPSDAMVLAATWLGQFHAANDERVGLKELAFLTRYDHDYYRQWSRRTSMLAGDWHLQLPWLAPLCRRAATCEPDWLSFPPTIIHGEFTPSNVLIKDDEILPVDWESAAVGLGEIDFVSLVEGWPLDVKTACETAYKRNRWSDGAPADFHIRVNLAWLYWHFRWLGEREDWFEGNNVGGRSEQLREVGESLGLI